MVWDWRLMDGPQEKQFWPNTIPLFKMWLTIQVPLWWTTTPSFWVTESNTTSSPTLTTIRPTLPFGTRPMELPCLSIPIIRGISNFISYFGPTFNEVYSAGINGLVTIGCVRDALSVS